MSEVSSTAQDENKHPSSTEDEQILDRLEAWQRERRKERIAKRKEQEKKQQNRKAMSSSGSQEKSGTADELEELRRDLLKATEDRDESLLRQTLTDVEDLGHVKELQEIYDKGRSLLTSIDRVKNLQPAKKKLEKMNSKTALKIRSDASLSGEVCTVLKAAFVLLGDKQRPGQDDLAFVREHCVASSKPKQPKDEDNPSGQEERKAVDKRIERFDVSRLDLLLARRSLGILKDLKREDAYQWKKHVGYFYDWTVGSCEECVLSQEEPKSATSCSS